MKIPIEFKKYPGNRPDKPGYYFVIVKGKIRLYYNILWYSVYDNFYIENPSKNEKVKAFAEINPDKIIKELENESSL